MSQKRKDNKRRVLRTGESQRKNDLIYQYRYTDSHGKRQTVYASDLKELRELEDEIRREQEEGLDYAAGNITVVELLERYISLKRGVRYNTKVNYRFVLNLVRNEEFERCGSGMCAPLMPRPGLQSCRTTEKAIARSPACAV